MNRMQIGLHYEILATLPDGTVMAVPFVIKADGRKVQLKHTPLYEELAKATRINVVPS